jgi:hypothetical protein
MYDPVDVKTTPTDADRSFTSGVRHRLSVSVFSP